MIKRISDERARIDGYKLAVGGAEFFNNRAYDEDFEWLILSYFAEILSSIDRQSPEYVQKLEPPTPDFQTYLAPGIPFKRIDPAAYERHIAALTQSPHWRDEILKELARRLKREPEILKLSPTTRSLL